ncbi:MAG: hypothetical protein FJZ62_01285 [Chlamydiae bacterium]|nr:hypothetical protein [Chlamydiota bacterium]
MKEYKSSMSKWIKEGQKELNPQRMGQMKEGHMDSHHQNMGAKKFHGANESTDKFQERRPLHGSPSGMKKKNKDARA